MHTLKDSPQLKYWNQYLEYIRNRTLTFFCFVFGDRVSPYRSGTHFADQSGISVCYHAPPRIYSFTKKFLTLLLLDTGKPSIGGNYMAGFCFVIQSHYLAYDGLESASLLPWPLKCWHCRSAPQCLVQRDSIKHDIRYFSNSNIYCIISRHVIYHHWLYQVIKC